MCLLRVKNGKFQSVLLLLLFSHQRDENDDDIPDAVVVLDDVPEQRQ